MRSAMLPGLIVGWWSYSTTLWYAQRVEGRRPDLRIVDDRTRLDGRLRGITDVIDEQLGRRPVCVIRDDPLELIDRPDARSLTRVLGPLGSGS